MKVELQHEDLEGCAILYDHIREIYKEVEDVDDTLASEFEQHIHLTLEKYACLD